MDTLFFSITRTLGQSHERSSPPSHFPGRIFLAASFLRRGNLLKLIIIKNYFDNLEDFGDHVPYLIRFRHFRSEEFAT